MSEQEQVDHYDVAATQDKWRKVWDELNPFQAADDGVQGASLRPDDVPLPQR